MIVMFVNIGIKSEMTVYKLLPEDIHLLHPLCDVEYYREECHKKLVRVQTAARNSADDEIRKQSLQDEYVLLLGVEGILRRYQDGGSAWSNYLSLKKQYKWARMDLHQYREVVEDMKHAHHLAANALEKEDLLARYENRPHRNFDHFLDNIHLTLATYKQTFREFIRRLKRLCELSNDYGEAVLGVQEARLQLICHCLQKHRQASTCEGEETVTLGNYYDSLVETVNLRHILEGRKEVLGNVPVIEEYDYRNPTYFTSDSCEFESRKLSKDKYYRVKESRPAQRIGEIDLKKGAKLQIFLLIERDGGVVAFGKMVDGLVFKKTQIGFFPLPETFQELPVTSGVEKPN